MWKSKSSSSISILTLGMQASESTIHLRRLLKSSFRKHVYLGYACRNVKINLIHPGYKNSRVKKWPIVQRILKIPSKIDNFFESKRNQTKFYIDSLLICFLNKMSLRAVLSEEWWYFILAVEVSKYRYSKHSSIDLTTIKNNANSTLVNAKYYNLILISKQALSSLLLHPDHTLCSYLPNCTLTFSTPNKPPGTFANRARR